MDARDVMTPDVKCVPPSATLREAAMQMKTLNVGALPVCDNDRLAGMITDRDIIVRSVADGHDPSSDLVRDAMTPGLIYCFDDQSTSEIAEMMADRQVRRLPVLNRNKQLVGIISLGDLATSTGDEELSGHALECISEPAAIGG